MIWLLVIPNFRLDVETCLRLSRVQSDLWRCVIVSHWELPGCSGFGACRTEFPTQISGSGFPFRLFIVHRESLRDAWQFIMVFVLFNLSGMWWSIISICDFRFQFTLLPVQNDEILCRIGYRMVFLFCWCNGGWLAISMCGLEFWLPIFAFSYVYQRFRLMCGKFLLPILCFALLIMYEFVPQHSGIPIWELHQASGTFETIYDMVLLFLFFSSLRCFNNFFCPAEIFDSSFLLNIWAFFWCTDVISSW
jgi:hypothetical protein